MQAIDTSRIPKRSNDDNRSVVLLLDGIDGIGTRKCDIRRKPGPRELRCELYGCCGIGIYDERQ